MPLMPRSSRRTRTPAAAHGGGAGRLARNVLLLLPAAVVLGLAVTPVYNRMLVNAGELLIHLGESPDRSARHYGPVARNFWGLGKHLLDLPLKLGLPLLLWAAFYLRLVLPARPEPAS
jgi:hypothetical protein